MNIHKYKIPQTKQIDLLETQAQLEKLRVERFKNIPFKDSFSKIYIENNGNRLIEKIKTKSIKSKRDEEFIKKITKTENFICFRFVNLRFYKTEEQIRDFENSIRFINEAPKK